ncbi:hypothetical protein E2C01_007632 [Portunus trituberculatus]|uniref:Uncharacterized protein n=1 Tax=Portunus trituberculatus TaxID=210409 RepID=A0A5B7CYM5_PORTR|nr:hypothetical protein [Portunus trituberculatus]
MQHFSVLQYSDILQSCAIRTTLASLLVDKCDGNVVVVVFQPRFFKLIFAPHRTLDEIHRQPGCCINLFWTQLTQIITANITKYRCKLRFRSSSPMLTLNSLFNCCDGLLTLPQHSIHKTLSVLCGPCKIVPKGEIQDDDGVNHQICKTYPHGPLEAPRCQGRSACVQPDE